MENAGFTTKIGNTTFIAGLKQSDAAKKSLDEKIHGLCAKGLGRRALMIAVILSPDKSNGGE